MGISKSSKDKEARILYTQLLNLSESNLALYIKILKNDLCLKY